LTSLALPRRTLPPFDGHLVSCDGDVPRRMEVPLDRKTGVWKQRQEVTDAGLTE